MKSKVILSSLFLPFFLCSCYASSYKATILITDVQSERAYIHFDSFEGQYVFKLKKLSKGEGNVHFTGSLGKGKIKVSYVSFGKESSLYTLQYTLFLNIFILKWANSNINNLWLA